ncbi:unnamed protein product, partial [Didymodactylos carnosus]
MTKGGSKQKKLGRLIFGGNRKHSPTKRSQTRTADVISSSTNNLLNIHDWAVWRMQLNEHMISGLSEAKPDLKYMRHFLQTNPFYQKYSHDPSNGRNAGVRLMFSIPHPKLRPEFVEIPNKSPLINNTDVVKTHAKNMNENNDLIESVNSVGATSHRSLKQQNSNGLHGHSDIRASSSSAGVIEAKFKKTVRTSYTGADRAHSTLQKAVKGGNVLEKIKAFEQVAAAAAEASNHTRILSVSSTTNPAASPKQGERWKSTPTTLDQQGSSFNNEQPYPIRIGLTSKGRYTAGRTNGQRGRRGPNEHHHHHDDRRHMIATPNGKIKASVLQPADGDIILKRRTPSQKTIQDEDCSITAISSLTMGIPVSPSRTLTPKRVVSPTHHYNEKHWFKTGGHHTPHRRDAGSRSRHNQAEMVKKSMKTISNTDLSKQQNGGKSTSRRRWLRRKENDGETVHDTSNTARQLKTPEGKISPKQIVLNKKQEIMSTKKKHKKAATNDTINAVVRKESTIQKTTVLDNNRVYGVPSTNTNTSPNEDEKQKKQGSPVNESGTDDIDQELTKNSDVEPQQQISDVDKKSKLETIAITKSPLAISENDDEYHKQMVVERVHKRFNKNSHKLSSTDGDILNQTSGMINKRNSYQTDKRTYNLDEERSQDEQSISVLDDVFIDDPTDETVKQIEEKNLISSRRNSLVITTKITRHQSSCEEQKHYPIRRNISQRSMKEHENVSNNENNQRRRSSIVITDETNVVSPNTNDPNINEIKTNRRWYWSKE